MKLREAFFLLENQSQLERCQRGIARYPVTRNPLNLRKNVYIYVQLLFCKEKVFFTKSSILENNEELLKNQSTVGQKLIKNQSV